MQSLVLRLADVNTAIALPPGARWGAKIDDVDASWYVGYRGCTAYDTTSKPEWCCCVQISQRVGSSTQAYHYVWLRTAGTNVSFGTDGGFVTVALSSTTTSAQIAAEVVLSIARRG